MKPADLDTQNPFLTVTELRDLIYRELSLRHEAHLGVHVSDVEALRVAYQSLAHRLEAMNEFRAALSEQSATFLTRSEHNALVMSIQERIEQMRESVRAVELSHSTLQARLYTIVSVVTVGLTAISLLLGYIR
ncbi:MAG TPA: hypothetical protein VFR55_08370 [Dehalococcoidia bacterium]|nr:hypothetical protein [Dehalococcoidia bacterium]